MASGMPAWVTKTFEFLTHPRNSSIRSTLEQSQVARRKSPLRVGVGAGKRKDKSRHSASQLHSRRSFNNTSSHVQERTQTGGRTGTYENRSTQTDEALRVHDGCTNLEEVSLSPSSLSLHQQGNDSSPYKSEPVWNLHPENPKHGDTAFPTEFLADIDGGYIPHYSSHGGAVDENMENGESTTPDAKSHEKNQETAAQDVEMSDGPPYTNGQAQVVLASDGFKDCLAILLTSKMVAKISQIATRSRRLEFITRKLKQVRREIASEENMLEYKNDALQDTNDQAEIARIKEETDRIQQRITEVTTCIDPLEEEIDTLTVNLAYCREQSQEVFEEVLGSMDLLDVLDPEFSQEIKNADEFDVNASPDSARGKIEAMRTDDGNEIRTSEDLDNASRRAAKADFEHRRNILIIIGEAFEHRQQNLAEEKAEYYRRVREGTCNITQTEFDLLALEDFRKMTADFRNAQEAFEESFKRAKQLGVLDERDAHYQESVFSAWSGGYPPSMESAMKGSTPTKSITYWQGRVEEDPNGTRWGGTELAPWSDPIIKPETTKLEDCDLQSVAMSDSWSCVDWSRNRRRIDRWREIAGRER
ncbi:MAG: hypothetical protein L6R41_006493 [Letrouitia leprolyta]|nr:MAG: hypothetical protein L6R41_006493 [Letrouitia leprolyta]